MLDQSSVTASAPQLELNEDWWLETLLGKDLVLSLGYLWVSESVMQLEMLSVLQLE